MDGGLLVAVLSGRGGRGGVGARVRLDVEDGGGVRGRVRLAPGGHIGTGHVVRAALGAGQRHLVDHLGGGLALDDVLAARLERGAADLQQPARVLVGSGFAVVEVPRQLTGGVDGGEAAGAVIGVLRPERGGVAARRLARVPHLHQTTSQVIAVGDHVDGIDLAGVRVPRPDPHRLDPIDHVAGSTDRGGGSGGVDVLQHLAATRWHVASALRGVVDARLCLADHPLDQGAAVGRVVGVPTGGCLVRAGNGLDHVHVRAGLLLERGDRAVVIGQQIAAAGRPQNQSFGAGLRAEGAVGALGEGDRGVVVGGDDRHVLAREGQREVVVVRDAPGCSARPLGAERCDQFAQRQVVVVDRPAGVGGEAVVQPQVGGGGVGRDGEVQRQLRPGVGVRHLPRDLRDGTRRGGEGGVQPQAVGVLRGQAGRRRDVGPGGEAVGLARLHAESQRSAVAADRRVGVAARTRCRKDLQRVRGAVLAEVGDAAEGGRGGGEAAGVGGYVLLVGGQPLALRHPAAVGAAGGGGAGGRQAELVGVGDTDGVVTGEQVHRAGADLLGDSAVGVRVDGEAPPLADVRGIRVVVRIELRPYLDHAADLAEGFQYGPVGVRAHGGQWRLLCRERGVVGLGQVRERDVVDGGSRAAPPLEGDARVLGLRVDLQLHPASADGALGGLHHGTLTDEEVVGDGRGDVARFVFGLYAQGAVAVGGGGERDRGRAGGGQGL